MTIFNCKTMRAGVIASAALLMLGILLLTPVLLLSGPKPYALVMLVYPGFGALLMSPLVLLATTLASLVPSVNIDLQNCQH